MAMLTGLIRRLLWLVVLGLVGGAVAQWWRERQAPDAPAAPEWPPIDVPDAAAPAAPSAEPADASIVPDAPAAAPGAETSSGAASIVNALVDAPEARSASGDGAAWVEPDADGACPISHPIKANDNSGIFHVPGGRFYDRTKAERCYVDADAAAADGYRQAKS